jgi:hypothetical protein
MVKERVAFNPINPTDPDILPGLADVGAVDGPGDEDIQKGYIWDAVSRAGLTFRNYGMHCDEYRYGAKVKDMVPLVLDPASQKLVFILRMTLKTVLITSIVIGRPRTSLVLTSGTERWCPKNTPMSTCLEQSRIS